MTPRAILLVLPVLLASAAPAPDPAQRCRDLVVPGGLMSYASVVPVGPTMCEFIGFTLSAIQFGYGADRLVVDAPATPGGSVPRRLHVEAHGVRQLTLDSRLPAVARFIAGLSTRPFAMSLDYDWTEDGRLTVGQVMFSSRLLGLVAVSAVLEGVSPDVMSASTQVRLRSVRLHMNGRGFFEAFLLPFALNASGLGGEPALFAAAKARAAAGATRLLAPGAASPASLSAILAFVDALPNPTHPLDISFDPPGPLPVSASHSLDELAAALPPGSVVAHYGD